MGPFACAASMGILVWISDRWVFQGWAAWARLGIQVVLGALLYGILVKLFRLDAWSEIEVLLYEFGGKRSRVIRWLGGTKARADA